MKNSEYMRANNIGLQQKTSSHKFIHHELRKIFFWIIESILLSVTCNPTPLIHSITDWNKFLWTYIKSTIFSLFLFIGVWYLITKQSDQFDDFEMGVRHWFISLMTRVRNYLLFIFRIQYQNKQSDSTSARLIPYKLMVQYSCTGADQKNYSREFLHEVQNRKWFFLSTQVVFLFILNRWSDETVWYFYIRCWNSFVEFDDR